MYKHYSVTPRECNNVFENGKIIGFKWKFPCPYFQNFFLHEIRALHARVDHVEFTEDDMTLAIGPNTYSLYDIDIDSVSLWRTGEKATLFIPYKENIKYGFHVIEVGIGIKHNVLLNAN